MNRCFIAPARFRRAFSPSFGEPCPQDCALRGPEGRPLFYNIIFRNYLERISALYDR